MYDIGKEQPKVLFIMHAFIKGKMDVDVNDFLF